MGADTVSTMERSHRRRGRPTVALVVGVGLLLGSLGAGGGAHAGGPARPRSRRPAPGTSCQVLPADNIWHTDISSLPVDPNSDAWLASMQASTTELHPDFGPPDYGIPFTVVADSTPKVDVKFRYAHESDRKRYPLTKRTPIEGGSDRHAIMIDKDRCTLYELYAVRYGRGHPTAGSGAIFKLGSNALRPDGFTSADAAGLPIFPGLIRYDEVKAGLIDHAIRFTADLTRDEHLWPARHDAGSSNPNYPPMGARFRLKADYDISGYSPSAQVILLAMKTYGLMLADNGSNWFFQGTVDKRWTNGLLDQLKQIPASAFEAVDESGCRVALDSAQSSC
jgi:hypothetical protein